jgi:hypothetical protein
LGDAVGECCNGADDNGNGIADEFGCSCETSVDCRDGNVCWSETFAVCAPRCNLIGGDELCRMIEPSLRCSPMTGTCVF